MRASAVAAVVAAIVGFSSHTLAQASMRRATAISPQPLASALRALMKERDFQIVYSSDLLANRHTPGAAGELTLEEALTQLLSGTGLTYRFIDEQTVTIVRPTTPLSSGGQRARGEEPRDAAGKPGGSFWDRFRLAQASEAAPADASPLEKEQSESSRRNEKNPRSDLVEFVVVTGTRIQGAELPSPMITISQDDMRMQGQTDLGQVARSLPQNFSGGQNPGVAIGAAGLNNQNVSGSSSLNLRGLGQDATLTLLNGTRLPYDGFTQATDVAMIPIAAIDRMEVLLDGASAIYGSDAVGGVANIILKRDYNGAEVSARWGTATAGGFAQRQFTAVAGTTWPTGGFIISADRNQNGGIAAGQRDYLAKMPADSSIYPSSTQTGTILSGHQRIGDRAELTLDAFYTKRSGGELLDYSPLTGYLAHTHRDSSIWGIAPSLRFELPGDWSLKLGGTLGKNRAEVGQAIVATNGGLLATTSACNCNDAKSASVESEGPIFALPGGDARLAVGGGYRANEFDHINGLTGKVTTGGRDHSRFVYSEVYLPLISARQEIPFIRTLSVSGALRREDYHSFGGTTTPKLGIVWGVVRDIEFKASWGRSFKVPTLLQQYEPTFLDLFPAASLGGSASPSAAALFLQGGNPNLKPETARTLTSGFAFHPEAVPGLNVGADWFDIDYTNRVVQPFVQLQSVLLDPAGFGFVTVSPTIAQQNGAFALAGEDIGQFYQGTPPPPLGPYDPSRVIAIVDDRYVNSAAQHIRGVDLNASYTMELLGGSFTANAAITWLNAKQKLTALAQSTAISGYAYYPPDHRWRIGGAWSKNGLALSTTINQTGGVRNNLFPDNAMGGAFTTVDFVLDYAFTPNARIGDLRFNLGIQNLFDRSPPYMRPRLDVYVNYDSTNYSAIGRVVNLTLTKRL